MPGNLFTVLFYNSYYSQANTEEEYIVVNLHKNIRIIYNSHLCKDTLQSA